MLVTRIKFVDYVPCPGSRLESKLVSFSADKHEVEIKQSYVRYRTIGTEQWVYCPWSNIAFLECEEAPKGKGGANTKG